MMRHVEEFVRQCDTCLRCKYETVAYPGLLQPFPIPEGVWQSVAMDFIVQLPKSKGKDTIWVIVDHLSKYAHFLALAHPFSAADIAQMFIDNIYKLHGAPANIVSDRDPLFTSLFWKEFLLRLGITQNLSTAYHPQSDGQSKVLNRCLEHYLHCFSWQNPHNWVSWLPMAKWWYNTTHHSTTQLTPFEVMYGQPPPLQLPYLPHESAMESIDRTFSAREALLGRLKEALESAQQRMKHMADLHHSERVFSVEDWVFLKTQPYRQMSIAPRSTNKLSPKYYGPFQVTAKVGPVAYTLALPPSSKVHLTFHVSLLKPCPDPNVPVVPILAMSPGEVGNKNPFAILDRRVVTRHNNAVTQVLVHWTDGLPEEATCVDWAEFNRCFPEFVHDLNP